MKTKTVKQIGIVVEGYVQVSLWGGGEGGLDMKPQFLPIEKATKDNILRSVNDGGFGVQSIDAAEIEIYDKYEGGLLEYNRTISVSNPIHNQLFNGWAELAKQGIN